MAQGNSGFGLSDLGGFIQFGAGFSGSALIIWPLFEGPFYGIDGYAHTLVTATGVYSTPGPARPGTLLVEASSSYCGVDSDYATVSFSVAGNSGDYYMTSCPTSIPMEEAWAFPVELGNLFELSVDFESLILSSAQFGHGGNFAGYTSLTITAFEQSGQRVQLSAVPEPSSLLLVLAGVGAAFSSRCRSR